MNILQKIIEFLNRLNQPYQVAGEDFDFYQSENQENEGRQDFWRPDHIMMGEGDFIGINVGEEL